VLHLLFLVYLLASYYAKSGSWEASCAQAVEDLQTSNYFVSLLPYADWKLFGWDKKIYLVKRSIKSRGIAKSLA
jgi:hypothetical protein